MKNDWRVYMKWLHLSDLHFNYENYDTKKMRYELIKFLSGLVKDESLDAIFITGDISYQNKNYTKDLREFIMNVKESVKTELLFIVPGNHDLLRGKDRTKFISTILNHETPSGELDVVMGSTQKKNRLLKPFSKYNKFIEDSGMIGSCRDLHSFYEYEKFTISSLNTCLLSGDVGEEGKLIINQNNLFDMWKKNGTEGNNKLNIAIGHHSIECLNDNEQMKFRNNLSDFNIHMYLAGHFHKPKIDFESNNIKNLYTFTVGATVIDGYNIPCFTIGELNTNNEVIIKYYKWFEEIEKWDAYSGVSRKADVNLLKFSLDLGCSQNEAELYEKIDDDEFKSFLIDFHESIITNPEGIELSILEKDLEDKFANMKCSPTMQKQFDSCSKYFPLIDEIMDSSEYISYAKRMFIIDVIVSEYESVYSALSKGELIVEEVKKRIVKQYIDEKKISKKRLDVYTKVLIFWAINQCDIFNEVID